MRNDAYTGRVKVPAVFDHNTVLRDRWLAHYKSQLDETLDAIKP